MEENTKKLLEECNAGCKMAINSMEQVEEYVEREDLAKLIATYKEKHQSLERKTSELLQQYGEMGKEPGAMASTFSWFTTEIKLLFKDDSNQVAKLMMDGCNMGIQSISQQISSCTFASRESLNLAHKLVETEEDFMRKLKEYL